jgi:hypothetical protein
MKSLGLEKGTSLGAWPVVAWTGSLPRSRRQESSGEATRTRQVKLLRWQLGISLGLV